MKNIKLKVVLTVNYKPNGVTKHNLKAVLGRAIEHMAENGLLTGETPAEVDMWDCFIAYLPTE